MDKRGKIEDEISHPENSDSHEPLNQNKSINLSQRIKVVITNSFIHLPLFLSSSKFIFLSLIICLAVGYKLFFLSTSMSEVEYREIDITVKGDKISDFELILVANSDSLKKEFGSSDLIQLVTYISNDELIRNVIDIDTVEALKHITSLPNVGYQTVITSKGIDSVYFQKSEKHIDDFNTIIKSNQIIVTNDSLGYFKVNEKSDSILNMTYFYNKEDRDKHRGVFPINKAPQRDFFNIRMSGNYFTEKQTVRSSKNPYICLQVNLKLPQLQDDYAKYSKISMDFSGIIKDKIIQPMNYINIYPEPDVINPQYIIYNSKEKLDKIINNRGFYIFAENLEAKKVNELRNYLYTLLLGSLLAFAVDLFFRLLRNWKKASIKYNEKEKVK